ncbi:MAG: peptidoglycan DD-metalloendopeptidase family protein [Fibrobacter sp.]|nr:peptidoglycan DD-metalloendopeptidase family protein [Fibrobacter sp.]
MQKKVLETLYKQGGISFFAFPGESQIDITPLQNIAQALNAGACFVILDFSGKNPFKGNTSFVTKSLTEHVLDTNDIDKLKSIGEQIIIAGERALPETDSDLRNLYHNLHSIQKFCPQVIGILPQDITSEEAERIYAIARLLIIDGDSLEECSIYLEDAPSLCKIQLLWLPPSNPIKKRFPKAYRAVSKSFSRTNDVRNTSYLKDPVGFAKIIEQFQKIDILSKNPLDGVFKVFKRIFPIITLFTIILPFLFSTSVSPIISNVRDRSHERDQLSLSPSFEYTFDGKENMQRIARYAIGRFNALITNEKMVKQYVDITLEENGYPLNSWYTNEKNIPPEGTVLKFSRPEFFETASDSIGSAWKYWTSIISDSVSYLTEFYYENPNDGPRQHNGIDLASRFGARILAPFAAKAWTSKDERGGTMISLVREKDILIFMHCDKLLYLDGQEVMAGDPIATVGTTGHTTGPHAHIVAGVLSKNGTKRIGNIRYNVIDPIKWFYKFKPTPSQK